jgi:hypothetical protein
MSPSRAYLGERYGYSRTTIWRRFQKLLSVHPDSVKSRKSPKLVLLDGFYLDYPSLKSNRFRSRAKQNVCLLLWALDGATNKPLAWKFYEAHESPETWMDFIRHIKRLNIKPEYIIYDGAMGATLAVSRYLKATIRQRCLVHILGNMNKDLGVAPKTKFAQSLKTFAYNAYKIKDSTALAAWAKEWEAFNIDQKEVIGMLQKHSVYGIPKSAYSAFCVVNNAYLSGELAAFIQYPGMPSTNNAIESHNRVMREILNRHRGIDNAKKKSLLAWHLSFKQQSIEEILTRIKHTF